MFTRIVHVRGRDKTYKYLQVVESYYQDGKSKKRVLGNLGQVELLGKNLGGLVRSLNRYCQRPMVVAEEIWGDSAGIWGRCWWRGICGSRWDWGRRWGGWAGRRSRGSMWGRRRSCMKRTQERLDKIVKAVSEGRLKGPAKIGARAARAMADDHGARHYSHEVTREGGFRFWEDKEKLEAETRREGRYILKTNDATITPADAVEAYKELATVEAGFRDLKDVLAMRPVWHKTDDRVRAHIFVATLALFLKRTLQHQLDQAKVPLRATEALEAMKSATVTELDLNGVKHRIVSGPSPDGHRVLNALGIRAVCPPVPPSGADTR
jgi:hypothetical protein